MKNPGKLIILTGILLVACGGGVTPPSAPVLSGQSALDAQATLAVWSAEGTAVAEGTRQAVAATTGAEAAQATTTAAAMRVTGEAAAVATGSAQATATTGAAQATATWDALVAREKAISVEQTAEAGAYFLSATATADAGIVAFMEAEAAQTLRERETAIARQRMWNRITPWLVGGVTAAATALLFLVTGSYMVERTRRVRPQQAGDTWVVYHPEGPRVIASPRPALPATAPRLTAGSEPVAAAEGDRELIELPAVRHGHALIAGETGSGKSTAMRAVLAARRDVVVLDPHSAGNDWGAARVVGAGRDFEAIRDYMGEMGRMLRDRYAARAEGRMDFEPRTVAVDEMPAIVGAIGRDIETTWREWLREGRKVGLYLVLATQSTRVRTLGIEGERDLLENFGVVLVLGDLARQEYRGLVEGMARPAVLHTKGRARPVLIPDATAATGPDVVEPPTSSLPPSPVYVTAEWPRREEPPIDPNQVDERARQRIIDEYRRELIFRRVQLRLFPQYADDGGQAGLVIRRVLFEAGMIERGDDGKWRPSARALGY